LEVLPLIIKHKLSGNHKCRYFNWRVATSQERRLRQLSDGFSKALRAIRDQIGVKSDYKYFITVFSAKLP